MARKRKSQIVNQTIFTGDNLDIMRGMDSESVDLIYLDPPFNSNRHYSAPIGSQAAGAEFKDAWTFEDTKHAWWGLIADEHPALYKVIDASGDIGGKGNKAYLIYMAMRLLELRRILKPTGTIYLHCDETMGHYLRLAMEAVFGEQNLIAHIIWAYGTSSGGRSAAKKPVKNHDILLTFAKNYGDHTFNHQYLPYEERYLRWFKNDDGDGRKYQTRMRKGKLVKQYLDESPGIPLPDVWADIRQIYGHGWFRKNPESTGYPTQKPLDLLRRIIAMSSDEGDVVFDPFCGCATACLAAEDLGRHWIGIDISPLAATLIGQRMRAELGLFGDIIHRTDIPVRTEQITPPSPDIKHTLFGRQEGACNGCGRKFEFQNFSIDHIIPTSKGGADTDDNLQLLCTRCNSVKGNRPMEFLVSQLIKDGTIQKPVKGR